MPLLHDIQAALLDDTIGVGTTLLKLRFLASKLDADILEEWVRYETEGYPDDVQIPDYRITYPSYTGDYMNSGVQLRNVSIPSYLIDSEAGEQWVRYKILAGLPVIDDQIRNLDKDDNFSFDCSNLKILLQGKFYKNMTLIETRGCISRSALTQVQHTVRAKALDFSLKIEKQVPAAAEIVVGQESGAITSIEQEAINNLTQNIFYGDVENVNIQSTSTANFCVTKGDTLSLTKALESAGFSPGDAKAFAGIMAREKPQDKEIPLGTHAQEWLKNKAKAVASEAWDLGKSVAKSAIIEIAKRYYGLT